MKTLLTAHSARVLLPVLWTTLSQIPLCAQRGITDALTPPAVAIGSTTGSYVLSGFESVNHYSGKLQFALPLLGVGERGEAGYTMTLPVARGWQVQAQLDGNGSPVSYFVVTDQTPGFHWWVDSAVPRFSPGKLVYRRSGSGLIECQSGSGPTGTYWYQSTLTRLTFIAADGSETELVDKPSGGGIAVHGACDGYGSNPPWTRPGPYVSRDGSAMTFYPDSPVIEDQDPATGRDQGVVSGTLYFRDGRKYTVLNGSVTAITDRNGNRVNLTYDASFRLQSVTDALDRLVSVSYSQDFDEIVWSRSSTVTRSLKVHYGNMSTVLASGQTIQDYYSLFGTDGGSSQLFDPRVVTSVELPNTQRYWFKYNSYGELAEVRLPTGGAFHYEWSGGIVNDRGKRIVVRRVIRRDVISEGETNAGYSTYAYESSPLSIDGRSYRQTKVTETPFGTGVSGSQSHYFYGDPQQLDNEQIVEIPETYWRQGREFITQEFNSSQIVLRTTSQTWEQRACDAGEACPSSSVAQIDPRITSRTTTLNETGDALIAYTGYDRFNNPTSWSEYDQPNGSAASLVRWGTTTYEVASTYTEAPAHLRSLPKASTTYGGASSLAQSTETYYDESALVNNSGMPGYTAPSGTARGNPTTVKEYLDFPTVKWLTTSRTFDIAGNVRTITDPRGKIATATYSSLTQYAFPDQVTNPLSHTTSMTWDNFLGKPLTTTGPNSDLTSYVYSPSDPLDRVSAINRTSGSTGFAYNDSARTRTTSVAQHSCNTSQVISSTEVFDGLGRPARTIQLEDSSQIEATIEYDGLGRKRRVSFPFRSSATAWTEYEYDALGRPTVERVTDGSTTSPTTFTPLGRRTTIADPAGKSRALINDAVGRLAQVRENPSGLNYLTSYAYDGAGRLTAVSQSGQTRTFTYDTAGRLVAATNPESGTINYRYDDAGNLVQRTDARGVTTCSGSQSGTSCTDPLAAYDGLNRPVKKTYSDGTPAVTYAYDDAPTNGKGRLRSVSVAGGTSVSYSYDVMGRVTASSQTTDGVTYPFTYTYNQAGGVETTMLPSGRSLKQCYDLAGRAKSVTGTKSGEPDHNYISQITYDSGGGMNQAQLGNGKWEDWDYNYRKQILGIKLGSTAGASDLLSLTFNYGMNNNNGNVLSQAIARPSFSVTQTYGYTDPLNRLSSVTEGTESRTFDYSATGNMWVATASANFAAGSFTPRTSAWYDANNRLVNTGLGIAYDSAGNQTAIGGYTNTFDAENRLKSSTINSVTTSYAYDGEGRRVRKGSQVMVYDAFGNLAAEYGGTVTSAGREYLTGDHLGSTRLVTNAAGSATKCADYLPFGEEIGQGVNSRGTCYGFTDPRQKFTGKERDAETGLDFFLARYYSGAQGRFTSPDWSETPQPVPYADFADPQTLNLYSYARNNPLALTDPDGHCPWCIGAAVGGFGGLAASYFGQKWSHPDKPINWKSVFASGIGGAVAGGSLGLATAPGALTTLMGETLIETGLAVKLTTAGITGVAGGMVTRGIESNADPNKTIGTPSEILTDAAMGAAGEGLGKVAGPGVKATTTAGRVVTLNEARVAAGTRTPASYGVRQGQLKTQQQVVGGVLGASADAAVRSRQEAAKRRAEEERNRQPGQQ